MAYTIKQVREWNASLKSKHSKPVAVFVGGTSGIGENAAKKLAQFTDQPTIYIVGRNEAAGTRIVQEMKESNPKGTYEFMRCDASQLHEVDKISKELQAREKKIDLLFLTIGGIAFSKKETKTKIDVNHVLRYYSRMRFIENLTSLLESAESPRVVSSLAGGKEAPLKEDNLDLTKEFSLSLSNNYPASMTSVVFEHLASQHPSISFIHEFPGLVATPLLKTTLGSIMGTVVSFLLKPLFISAEESGEWQVFISTYPAFPAKDTKISAEQDIKVTQASTGEQGGGVYLLEHTGRNATNETLMAEFRKEDMPSKVWKHTLDTFDRMLTAESTD